MLSLRTEQRGLFEADHLWLDHVGRKTFYGFLATHRGELFQDEEFAELYSRDQGRPSVPPSLLATTLLLQVHDRASDEEARQRACFDLRWKVALGLEAEDRPFAKSTLQLFRAQLILHEKMRLPFERSLELARKRGYLKPERKLKLALDTTAVLGQGAVKDTYNLLADGSRKLIWELAQQERQKPHRWAEKRGLGRYFGSSIKGEAELDWSDIERREEFLSSLVEDAERLLELARAARGHLEEGSRAERRLLAAAQLLGQLLLQDVERKPEGGVQIRQGTSAERIPSAHDPEIRHGRKSQHVRFDGHKLALAVDTEEQLITAVDVIPGSAKDDADALQLVEQSSAATGLQVEQVFADAAYGSAKSRLEFKALGIDLVAKVGRRPEQGFFSKDRFEIDWEAKTCRCPAGQVTSNLVGRTSTPEFRFDRLVCNACPLRSQCYTLKSKRGRQVNVGPHEGVLIEARARQRSPGFQQIWRRRQVVEHRIARMVQLGMRRARYRGRNKTLMQGFLTAAVANLTWIAGAEASESARSWAARLLQRLLEALHSQSHTWFAGLTLYLALRQRGASQGSLRAAFRPDF
ncbi:MAG TPA: IS1182 family transposase [Chloroflexota bacterium]|jgi:transposase